MGRTEPSADETARPARKGGSRLFPRRLAKWLILLLVVAVVAATYFRTDILNLVLPPQLTARLGLPTEINISRFDWGRADIDRIRIGESGALAMEGVHLRYDPLSMRLEGVHIDQLVLSAAYDGVLTFGELDPLIEELRDQFASGDDDAQAGMAPLPEISFGSIEVDVNLPKGLVRGRGAAWFEDDRIILDLRVTETGHAFIDINLWLFAPHVNWMEPLKPILPSGSLRARIDAQSALWPLVGLTQPGSGLVDIDAELHPDEESRESGKLAATGKVKLQDFSYPGLPTTLSGTLAASGLIEGDWWEFGKLTSTGKFELQDFAYPGLPAPLSGTLTASSRLDRNHVEISDLAAAFTGGLTPDWTTSLAGALKVESLADAPTANGTLTLESGGEALSLAERGLPGVTLAQPSLSLATRLEGGMQHDGAFELSLALLEPARLAAASMALPGGVALPKATAITMASADQPFLRLARDAGRRLVADLALPVGKTSLTLEAPALEPKGRPERLILAMPAATLTAHYDSAPDADQTRFAAALDLKGAQLAVPTRGIALGTVAINAVQDATGTKLKMTSGSVTGLGAFVPVRAEIEATLSGSATRFKARFRGIEQPLDLTLAGNADLDSLKGEVEVKLAPLDFAVGGLQPYNFFPPLRSYFEDVSGRIEATGPVQFAKGKLSSALKLGIENFSGKVGPVHLINVNSVIEIDRPWPLSTKPDQTVAIELADVGLPLKDALFRFKVSNGTTMDVAESRLELAGGQVRLDPVTLNFDAPVHNLRLGVNQISVSRLFDLVGIAGLSGEGSISGAVPVTIFPGGIAIPDAELRADAPGVLRYDRDQAPLALQSAGESVALALQALADFHYEELIVNLRRSLAGDVHLGLHISGRNPSFYDGYPVEFNLTVEGRLDQALREGLAGYQVPDMIQEQLEGLTP